MDAIPVNNEEMIKEGLSIREDPTNKEIIIDKEEEEDLTDNDYYN